MWASQLSWEYKGQDFTHVHSCEQKGYTKSGPEMVCMNTQKGIEECMPLRNGVLLWKCLNRSARDFWSQKHWDGIPLVGLIHPAWRMGHMNSFHLNRHQICVKTIQSEVSEGSKWRSLSTAPTARIPVSNSHHYNSRNDNEMNLLHLIHRYLRDLAPRSCGMAFDTHDGARSKNQHKGSDGTTLETQTNHTCSGMLPRILLCKKCVCVCVQRMYMHIQFIVFGCLFKILSQPLCVFMRLLLVLLCAWEVKSSKQIPKTNLQFPLQSANFCLHKKKQPEWHTWAAFVQTCESSNLSVSCVIFDFHSFSFAFVWASCSTRLLLWRWTINCRSFINSRFACNQKAIHATKLPINCTSCSLFLCAAATAAATGGGAAANGRAATASAAGGRTATAAATGCGAAIAASIRRRGGCGGNPSGCLPDRTINEGNSTQCSAVSIRFSGLK